MQHVRLCGFGFAVAGALVLWGCGGGGGYTAAASPTAPTAVAPAPTAAPTAPTTPTASTVTVSIVGSTGTTAYQPNPIAAKAGDTVAFRNGDSVVHHIVMDDGSGDLGDILPGTSKTLTVRSASATAFHCTLHASMVGSINGALPGVPPCMPDAYGYGC